ncbi:unnamed protein product [Dibothriocephalus latus]|uniref:Sec23/Sec24 helical domain-containing protein n=1 Tax=Dibothriocephalus latus TaxID=60516 RepID=A0A3P7MC03_DIBLA|nr:unnamed protein product [Dibothriocephalus latus]
MRMHNLALSTSANASDIFRLADLDTYMNWLSKTCLQATLTRNTAQIVADVTAKVAHTLTGYRRLCTGGAQGANPGELVLPETIKLLPLYAQCLFKLDAIRPARNSTIDDRCYMMYLLNGMGVEQSNKLIYPTIIPLHSGSLDPSAQLPVAIRCSAERLLPDSAYFIHNGLRVTRQGDLSEAWVKRLMYEDRDDCGNATYVEYLCHIHKEVRSMLK